VTKREPDIRWRLPGATRKARHLRREETDAERKLWSELRNRRLCGYKFTRQVPLGPYIVDFLCRSHRLVVELDGDQHAWSETDAGRTAYLNRYGYSVLRFWNNEVFKETDEVLTTILAVLGAHVRGPSPGLRFAPADLSPRGEE
jgi:very-short-patch-repair endonuclease